MGLRAEPHTKPPSKLTELIFIPIFAQMILVTRKEHFNAAHKLENPNWTDEKNREVFGKCANKNWHGHNYQLFITVKGEPDPETGYVTDLKKMSTTIREHIIEKVEHKNLKNDVDFMQGRQIGRAHV